MKQEIPRREMSPGRPEMVLFDYGGTLLCEPERDALRGERAVLAHAVSNPLLLSPEALSAWEQEHIRSRWFLRAHVSGAGSH